MIAAFKEVDPITLEVLRNRLDGIAEEMELTLVRSSFSPVVKESMDASASLFTLEGTSLAQAAAIPLHLATLIPCVDRILKTFPVETMREDDVFVINDPYLGGTHLPDIAVILPVFHEGRPVALACTMTHHQDVGGMTAGSVPTDATEIFQEGIRIPPLKLRDAGEWNQTLLDVLERNVRMPMTFLGDLHAQIASCSIGARRVAALAAEHGAVALDAMFEALIARSEELTRQAIRALPERAG